MKQERPRPHLDRLNVVGAALRLSQRDVARALGCTYRMVWAVCTGERPLPARMGELLRELLGPVGFDFVVGARDELVLRRHGDGLRIEEVPRGQ